MRCAPALLLASALLASAPAGAERGALTAALGGGATLLNAPVPYAPDQPGMVGTSATIRGELRYALSHRLEVGLSGFFEPPTTYFHNGISLTTANGTFPGTLTDSMYRLGGAAGARYSWGMIVRPFVGGELGWSHRSYSALQHINDVTDPAHPRDYNLGLAAYGVDNPTLTAIAGIEWLGDHFSMALAPRLELLLGTETTWAFTVPFTLAWSWYL